MIHSFCSAENTTHEDFGLSVYDVIFVHVHTPAPAHKKRGRSRRDSSSRDVLCRGNNSEGQHHFDTLYEGCSIHLFCHIKDYNTQSKITGNGYKQKQKQRSTPGIEPGTSSTLRMNHTPRPSGRDVVVSD